MTFRIAAVFCATSAVALISASTAIAGYTLSAVISPDVQDSLCVERASATLVTTARKPFFVDPDRVVDSLLDLHEVHRFDISELLDIHSRQAFNAAFATGDFGVEDPSPDQSDVINKLKTAREDILALLAAEGQEGAADVYRVTLSEKNRAILDAEGMPKAAVLASFLAGEPTVGIECHHKNAPEPEEKIRTARDLFRIRGDIAELGKSVDETDSRASFFLQHINDQNRDDSSFSVNVVAGLDVAGLIDGSEARDEERSQFIAFVKYEQFQEKQSGTVLAGERRLVTPGMHYTRPYQLRIGGNPVDGYRRWDGDFTTTISNIRDLEADSSLVRLNSSIGFDTFALDRPGQDERTRSLCGTERAVFTLLRTKCTLGAFAEFAHVLEPGTNVDLQNADNSQYFGVGANARVEMRFQREWLTNWFVSARYRYMTMVAGALDDQATWGGSVGYTFGASKEFAARVEYVGGSNPDTFIEEEALRFRLGYKY